MKLHYQAGSDRLSIELCEGTGATSREITPGITAAFDGHGQVIGLDIALASGGLDLSQLETIALLNKET